MKGRNGNPAEGTRKGADRITRTWTRCDVGLSSEGPLLQAVDFGVK